VGAVGAVGIGTAGTMVVGGASAGVGAAAGSGGATTAPQTCSTGMTGKSGRTTATLQNAGVTRNYILNVPSSYKGDKPVPLVVFFHPLLTDAATAERSSGYTELANKEGFIVAYPDGQESAAWNVGPCCTQSRDVDDIGFARALVAKVETEYCVDAKRVYAAGFSMGGGMAHYVGCEAADVFAAIAPGAFDLLAENTCAPVRPITVIAFRSESDAIVPYAGGEKTSAPNGFMGKHTFLGAVPTFKRWAEVDGCTGEPMAESGGCQTYKQCNAGVEVTLCTVPGGHTWPSPERSWQTLSRFALP
jgi:polyhydroxybutyrate depolymerase